MQVHIFPYTFRESCWVQGHHLFGCLVICWFQDFHISNLWLLAFPLSHLRNLPPLCPRYPCCLLSPLFLAEQYIIIAVSLVSSAANINGSQEQGYSNRRRENKRRLTLTIVKGTITALGMVVILAKVIWAPDWFLEKATHVYTQTFPHTHTERERENMIIYLFPNWTKKRQHNSLKGCVFLGKISKDCS